MAITLNLAPEQEAQVRRKAQTQGRDAENYVAELVMRDIIVPTTEPSAPSPSASSLAELLHGRIGLFENDETAYEAQGASQSFAQHLADKHRAGSL